MFAGAEYGVSPEYDRLHASTGSAVAVQRRARPWSKTDRLLACLSFRAWRLMRRPAPTASAQRSASASVGLARCRAQGASPSRQRVPAQLESSPPWGESSESSSSSTSSVRDLRANLQAAAPKSMAIAACGSAWSTVAQADCAAMCGGRSGMGANFTRSCFAAAQPGAPPEAHAVTPSRYDSAAVSSPEPLWWLGSMGASWSSGQVGKAVVPTTANSESESSASSPHSPSSPKLSAISTAAADPARAGYLMPREAASRPWTLRTPSATAPERVVPPAFEGSAAPRAPISALQAASSPGPPAVGSASSSLPATAAMSAGHAGALPGGAAAACPFYFGTESAPSWAVDLAAVPAAEEASRDYGGIAMEVGTRAAAMLYRLRGPRHFVAIAFAAWARRAALLGGARSAGEAAKSQLQAQAEQLAEAREDLLELDLLQLRWAFAVWQAHLVLRRGRQRADVLYGTLTELSAAKASDYLAASRKDLAAEVTCLRQRLQAASEVVSEAQHTAVRVVASVRMYANAGDLAETARKAAVLTVADAPGSVRSLALLGAMDEGKLRKHALQEAEGLAGTLGALLVDGVLRPVSDFDLERSRSIKSDVEDTDVRCITSPHRGKARIESAEQVLARARLGRCFMMWSVRAHQQKALVALGADHAAARLLRNWSPEECSGASADDFVRRYAEASCQVFQTPTGDLVDNVSQAGYLRDACTQAVRSASCQTEGGAAARRAIADELCLERDDAVSQAHSDSAESEFSLMEDIRGQLDSKLKESRGHLAKVLAQATSQWNVSERLITSRRDALVERTISYVDKLMISIAFNAMYVEFRRVRLLPILRRFSYLEAYEMLCPFDRDKVQKCFAAWLGTVDRRMAVPLLKRTLSDKRPLVRLLVLLVWRNGHAMAIRTIDKLQRRFGCSEERELLGTCWSAWRTCQATRLLRDPSPDLGSSTITEAQKSLTLEALVLEAARVAAPEAKVRAAGEDVYQIGDSQVVVQLKDSEVFGKRGDEWVPLQALLSELFGVPAGSTPSARIPSKKAGMPTPTLLAPPKAKAGAKPKAAPGAKSAPAGKAPAAKGAAAKASSKASPASPKPSPKAKASAKR
eukprot:TRINITY_DN29563_c0_g1_i1.p1 TRINITY_DN29563_c0_g1~~TRINITY_DN29563_c0_g1_i1.p1  ORF type:complete len:1136 (-),score=199.41 TRINITY_DN29563_c0_g1_i1:114-3395(-)